MTSDFLPPKGAKSELNGLNHRFKEGLEMQQLGYHVLKYCSLKTEQTHGTAIQLKDKQGGKENKPNPDRTSV